MPSEPSSSTAGGWVCSWPLTTTAIVSKAVTIAKVEESDEPEPEDYEEAASGCGENWNDLSQAEKRREAVYAKAMRLACSGEHLDLPAPLATYIETLMRKREP